MAATAHTEVFWPAGSICCSDQPPASNDVESCSAPLRGLTIRYQKRAVLFPRRHGLPTCENCAFGALGGLSRCPEVCPERLVRMSGGVLKTGRSLCHRSQRRRGRRRARHPAPAKHSERVPPLPPLRTSPRTTPLPSLRRRHARSLAPPPAPTPDAGAPLARSPPTIRCPEAGPDDRVRRGVKRANVRSGVKQGTLGALCQHWATEGPETSTAPG